MASNVAAIMSKDTATVEDAKTWVRAMKEKGRWSEPAARIRLTALDALASVLGSEESRAAKDVLETANVLQKRWAIGKNADGDTAQVYGGSVRGTLKLYLDYLDDPTKAWANFDAKPKKARKRAQAEVPPAANEVQSALPLATVPVPAAQPVGEFRSFPFGDSRSMEFRLPANFTVRDLAKVTCHMATYCTDFDPARPTQGTVVSMARVGGEQE